MSTDAAVFLRVSGDSQDSASQIPDVKRFCAHHDLRVVKRYTVSDSAWKQGPEYRAAIARMLADAHPGHFRVLVVWALDRIVRNGSEPGMSAAEEALALIRKLSQEHVMLTSVKEPWLNGSTEIQSILVSFAAWMGQMESQRRSERIKIGLRAREAAGLPIGRKPGARDLRPRRPRSR
jgi:DNA invertase Pin-like site-specific DNA recombinase